MVIKTGSTELSDRLPIHLSTTLRCYPKKSMIFSDYEEDYQGEHIYDALESVDLEVLASHADFALDRHLVQNGTGALAPSELSGPDTECTEATQSGKTDNPGWKLDKWKFLPIVNRTFYEHPDLKWHVFVEADSFILWASLRQYLAVLHYTKPDYTGSQNFVGNDV